MLNSIFYHSLTRKYVIAFGNLFNDIYIRRVDANKNTVQTFPVPIQWGPRQKWEALIANPPQDAKVAIQVPRMGFTFTNIQYDPNRQKSPLNRHSNIIVGDDYNRNSQYAPVPYKITAELNVYSKNIDDAYQIMEQIVPFFQPDFQQQLHLIPEMNISLDTKYVLTGSMVEEVYEGEFLERKYSVHTFTFEIDAWYFGPIDRQGVIKRVQVDMISVPGSGPITGDEVQKYGRSHRLVVRPGMTPDGKPTTDPDKTIPYQQINPEDDYGFIEESYFFSDGKKYDPRSGTDK